MGEVVTHCFTGSIFGMSEAEHANAENVASTDTKLILWRLDRMEESMKSLLTGNHTAHLEIFKRLGTLEKWKIGVVAGFSVVGVLATALWEWVTAHHP